MPPLVSGGMFALSTKRRATPQPVPECFLKSCRYPAGGFAGRFVAHPPSTSSHSLPGTPESFPPEHEKPGECDLALMAHRGLKIHAEKRTESGLNIIPL